MDIKLKIGDTFPVTHWEWVVDYPLVHTHHTHGIGGSCGSGRIERARVIGAVNDNDCANFISKQMRQYDDGICYICELIDAGAPHGTAAGTGYKFFISENMIEEFMNEEDRVINLNKKLKNMKFIS
jgi:hypothetical protein